MEGWITNGAKKGSCGKENNNDGGAEKGIKGKMCALGLLLQPLYVAWGWLGRHHLLLG